MKRQKIAAEGRTKKSGPVSSHKHPKHYRAKNPSESLEESAELSRSFHGRDNEYIEDVIEPFNYRRDLAHLGDLTELEVMVDNKHVVPINFAPPDTEEHVSLSSSPDRRQLYLSGGDQTIDLDEWDELSEWEKEKDFVCLGEVFSITYFTDKHHLEGPKSQEKGVEYIHEFGEEGGTRPKLVYDRLNENLTLVGGSYEVRDEGIWN